MRAALGSVNSLAEQILETDKFLKAEKKRLESDNTPVGSRKKKTGAAPNGSDLSAAGDAGMTRFGSKDPEDLYEELHQTFENLIVYFYYQLTLLEIFDDSFVESEIRKAEQGLFDSLATVRQTLSLNSDITKILLDEARKGKNMRPMKILG